MLRFAFLNEPPFCFRGRQGVPTGCDVELARVIAERLEREITFVETDFSQLLPGLSEHQWDITTGLFITAERAKVAAFSRPIWTLTDGLLVARGNPVGLGGYASIASAGARLVVVQDQVQHLNASAAGVLPEQILVCPGYEAAAHAVIKGDADAFASVARAHLAFAAAHSDRLEVVEVPQSEQPPAPGAFALRLQDVDLLGDVDRELSGFLGTKAQARAMEPFGLRHDEYAAILR